MFGMAEIEFEATVFSVNMCRKVRDLTKTVVPDWVEGRFGNA